MNANFVAMSAMEIQIRALKKRIESFESGSAYQKLKPTCATPADYSEIELELIAI